MIEKNSYLSRMFCTFDIIVFKFYFLNFCESTKIFTNKLNPIIFIWYVGVYPYLKIISVKIKHYIITPCLYPPMHILSGLRPTSPRLGGSPAAASAGGSSTVAFRTFNYLIRAQRIIKINPRCEMWVFVVVAVVVVIVGGAQSRAGPPEAGANNWIAPPPGQGLAYSGNYWPRWFFPRHFHGIWDFFSSGKEIYQVYILHYCLMGVFL